MAINATGLFSTAASSSAASYWKPVTSSAAGATTVAGSTGDTVAVSKLAQALTGVAADAFQSLRPKAREMLEGFINDGKASAEDVVKALKTLAAEAAFGRYLSEAPKDKEDFLDPEIAARIEEINKGLRKGQPPSADEWDKICAIRSDHMNKILSKRGKEFMSFDLGLVEPGSKFRTTEEGRAAAEKLGGLGFDVSVYREDFREYAKTIDIPGIGRRAPPVSSPPASPPASAPPAASPAAPGADEPSASAAEKLQASLNTGAAAGTVANGQSAVTLLQSAQGGAAASGSLGAQQPAGNSLLGTLSRSLKPK